MKESVTNMCDRFIEDLNTVKKECGFFLMSHDFLPLHAFLFTAHGRRPDPQQIKICAKILQDAVGNSSCFGDSIAPSTACLLSMRADAETLIADAIANYRMIKKNYLIVNPRYHSLSGLIMELINRPGVKEEKAAQSHELYESLRKRYSPMESDTFSVMSMLLAYSGKSNKAILEETDCIYNELKSFANDKGGQLAALLLTYFDKPIEEKTARLCELYNILAGHKPKYPRSAELLCLAAISMFGDDPATAADNIISAFDELGEKKGYKGFLATIDPKTRMVHAALVVMANYLAESRDEDMYIPTLAAAFLPIMYNHDKTTAAIMAGNGAL